MTATLYTGTSKEKKQQQQDNVTRCMNRAADVQPTIICSYEAHPIFVPV